MPTILDSIIGSLTPEAAAAIGSIMGLSPDVATQGLQIVTPLLDLVGDNDRHPLTGLVDILSDQISAYEAEHHPPPVAMGVAALRFLMDEHGLTQSDFKREIGSQGVVSEILNGHRKLNLKHIKKLAERFQLSPETFID